MADTCESGSIKLGHLSSPTRLGTTDAVLHWEAVRRPLKVCEGGGWYSSSPDKTGWCFRSWMAHKARPGWGWPSVANDTRSLDELIARDVADAARRYNLTEQA